MSKGYFAARSPEKCAAALLSKVEDWKTTLESTGYLNKLRNLYSAYHGAYFDTVGESHQISFGGDDEELVELAVNHLRNIAQHMLVMTTSVRPAMEARAINTDAKSQVQTRLANGLLDYYMRQKQLEQKLRDSCELAISMTSGWVKLAWNENLGEITNQKEIEEAKANGEEIPPKREGDVEFTIHSVLDVVQDMNNESDERDWLLCRTFKNRFDLIATYPDLKEEIMRVESKDNQERIRFSGGMGDETDLIPVWEFFHKKTESMPDGRYMLFVSEKATMYDGPLPYRRIPMFEICPAKILGSPLRYTPLFDLLPIQDGINSLYSTVMTNQHAFGVQNIMVPSGCNIDVSQMGGGLNIIDYNPQYGKPESLDLLKTPKEVFDFLNMLVQAAETISGINSVVRGNPESSLRSGSAIAMIQSNAIQFMSGLQQSYIHQMENVGLCLLEILIDFADSPRIADIIGESGKSYAKTYIGTDLSNINRVVVDSANPLTKSISGRVQMADNLLQYSTITPKQYMNVINTGNLDTATEDDFNETILMKSENEGFLNGIPAVISYLDAHMEHITKHKAILYDPMLRRNQDLQKLVLQHIQEHFDMLKQVDPMILMAMGQQPMQQQQPPVDPNQPAPPAGQEVPPEQMENPQNLAPVDAAVQATGAQPNTVRIPEGFEEAPLTPEQNMNQIR